MKEIYREKKEERERTSMHWVTPQVATMAKSSLSEARNRDPPQVSNVGTEGPGPSSMTFPGYKQGDDAMLGGHSDEHS